MQVDRRGFLGGTAAAALAGVAGPVFAHTGATTPVPPIARIEPVTESFFGRSVTDPYRWMETSSDPDWEPFMRGNAGHARATLDAIPGRPALLERISGLTGSNAMAKAPTPAGDKLFYEKRAEGKDTAALMVRQGGTDRILIDPDALKAGGTHVSLDWWQPSPDGSHVVYGLSPSGSEASILHIMRVADGDILPERIDRTQYASPAWLPDGTGFFYLRLSGAPAGTIEYYTDSVTWLHRLNTPESADVQILKRGLYDAIPAAPTDFPVIATDPSSDHVVASMIGGVRRENPMWTASLADLLSGHPTWRLVGDVKDELIGGAIRGDELYLLSTKDAENGKILKTRLSSPSLASSEVVVPHGDEVIEFFMAAQDGLYVVMMDGGYHSLNRLNNHGVVTPVTLPFAGSILELKTAADQPGAWIQTTSWLEPISVLRVEADGSVADTGLSPKPDIDTSPYEAVRDFAVARDGTRVPISIVARKGLRRDGSAPTLVTAYGAYQISQSPGFNTRGIAFLDQGGVLAVAHVRGGGEYGKRWWRAGRKLTKPNTWRDLIDCCEHLVDQKWTSPAKLAIRGGSAGGITIGRALTERPDLFAVAIPAVGCLNQLRNEFTQNGPPNVEEFGTVATEEGFKGLYEMDAMHHVIDGTKYPAVMMTHGMTDPRVEPWNSAKMTARLRTAASNDSGPILLRVEFKAGHGIGSTRSQADEELADVYSFILWNTGQAGFQPT